MKIAVVTGSRDWPSYGDIAYDLEQFKPDLIVHGKCPTGADSHAEEYGKCHVIHIRHFKADWNLSGRSAGPIRNKKMIVWAEDMKDHGHEVKVFAYRLNESTGTSGCIQMAKMHCLNVTVRDMVRRAK